MCSTYITHSCILLVVGSSLQVKADFLAMLGESDAITERSQWKKMKGLFEQDPRYKAMDSSSKREALFKDYIQSLVEKSQVSKIHCKQRCLIVNFLMFFFCSQTLSKKDRRGFRRASRRGRERSR